jgi:NhaP-type Na+/H+ or K+/H+ antiporter
LTILLGFGVGVILFRQLTLLEIAILATMLAPTDAALGSAVVSNKSVPAEIREGLNVESGLNDGICVPILFLFLTLASASGAEGSTAMLMAKLVVREIGIGVIVGVGLTLLGRWLFDQGSRNGWVSETWQYLPLIALAVTCFAVAQQFGGSGFIACFTGGLLFGSFAKSYKHAIVIAAEGAGHTFTLVAWVVFGAAVVGQYFSHLSWEVVLYAGLSLTVVRMFPVYLSLAGINLCTSEKLFIGWFGPRGLASIVFGVIVINEHLPGGHIIAITAVCTIVLSIFAHGFSANPLVKALGERLRISEDK